uniref:Uncharacterized protein n=1 Tax=Leptobrachium leishanense TaxID=445787 RepID=A0A8C5M2T4_9ANUR
VLILMGNILSCCARPGQSSISSTPLKHLCASSWKTLEIPSPKKDEEKITIPSPSTYDLLSSSSSQGTGQTRHGRTETATPPPILRQAGVVPQGPFPQTAITATTGELMHCLDVFIVDYLLLQGWQKQTFMTAANIGVETIDDLRATFYTYLYIAYAYLGWEISYTVQPFITEPNRCTFWKRCLIVKLDKFRVEKNESGNRFFLLALVSEIHNLFFHIQL